MDIRAIGLIILGTLCAVLAFALQQEQNAHKQLVVSVATAAAQAKEKAKAVDREHVEIVKGVSDAWEREYKKMQSDAWARAKRKFASDSVRNSGECASTVPETNSDSGETAGAEQKSVVVARDFVEVCADDALYRTQTIDFLRKLCKIGSVLCSYQ